MLKEPNMNSAVLSVFIFTVFNFMVTGEQMPWMLNLVLCQWWPTYDTYCMSKVTCCNILGDMPAFTHTQLSLFLKAGTIFRGCGGFAGMGSGQLPYASEITWEGHTLARPLEPLKMVEERAMLSYGFRRLQRLQTSILWSHFKNEGLRKSRVASGRPQRLVNRKRTSPEYKQRTTDSGQCWGQWHHSPQLAYFGEGGRWLFWVAVGWQ